MYTTYTCRLSCEGLIVNDILRHAGVWKVFSLSPLLFLVVLDGIMNRVNSHKHRGMEWALIKMSDDLDYADDLYLLSQKRADMQTEIDDLKKDAEYTELKINTRNTKEINLGAKNESINLSTSGASCQLDGNTKTG